MSTKQEAIVIFFMACAFALGYQACEMLNFAPPVCREEPKSPPTTIYWFN